ncbi:hypothetical protein ACFQZS_19290 [Mucilaginibacter calamicampi]|uniref:Uncharacterized protein n=2 Tax=Mucilaginibacter calamicampi TaxID=1302352 RepID=A0ABW2Z2J9_9SPHI
MIIILVAIVSEILLLLFFYTIIPKNIPVVFWAKVELFWVLISFMGVIYGTIEVLGIDKKGEYDERLDVARLEFQEAQILLGEHVPMFNLTKASEGQQVGLAWFHKVADLMDEGYESPRWEGFVNYTEGFVFKSKEFPVKPRSEALRYAWPANPDFKSDDIAFKENIKLFADKLENSEREKERLKKQAPDSTPHTLPRYCIALIFLVGLSLKILKIRHEAYR